MYQVGDYIVKALNGVCKVKAIVHPDFVSDKKKLYYLLTPVADENANLYVPVDRGDESARPVMTESEAENLVKKIPTIDAIWINNERERERSYKEAVQSNDPERLVVWTQEGEIRAGKENYSCGRKILRYGGETPVFGIGTCDAQGQE